MKYSERLMEKLRARGIPAHCRQGIVDYVVDGAFPGGFLTHVLSNDFRRAYFAADLLNQRAITNYLEMLQFDLPAACHGSLDAMESWHAVGGIGGDHEIPESLSKW